MSQDNVIILAIETSCDDTCAAISYNGSIKSNVILTQKIHDTYGGVVPEISAREHLRLLPQAIEQALKQSNTTLQQLSAIAFTYGPGLQGPLLVGMSYAKGMALGLNLPLIPINHLKGHIHAAKIDNDIQEPFLSLLISGGNTMIVKVDTNDTYTILSQTVDDAIGEAYDKIAKILQLEYPGGKHIDMLAKKGKKHAYTFPSTKISEDKFSFSGIKTAFKNFITQHQTTNPNFIQENIHDICASIQDNLLNTLIHKLTIFIEKENINTITIGGGVAANEELKLKLQHLSKSKNVNIFIPQQQYCVDNAAMIANCAYGKYIKKQFCDFNYKTKPQATIEKD